jgi:hypothetical protein
MRIHGIIGGIEEELCAPPDKILQVVRIAVSIEPPSGALMIYGGPDYEDPVLIEGPGRTAEIPTKTLRVIVQMIRGAKRYEIETLGYLAQRPHDD